MRTIFSLLKTGLILALFVASILAPSELRAQITNGGFESGTTGWTGSGFTTSTGETVLNWNVQPADGQMGRVTPGVAASTAQSTLGLTSSQLTGITKITNVGYVYQDINLTAGQEITVYWNYVSQDYSPYDDGTFACLTRSGEEQFKILARTFGTSDIGIPNTNAYGSTGWHTVSFTAGTTGTYRLGLGAFNWSDQAVSPILYIDDAIGGTSSPQQPTVSTSNPSNISNNSATLGGQVTSAGTGSVTDRGIVYSSSNSSPTIGNGTQVQIGTGLGSYSTTVSGLSNGETYYVRAYATSSGGTSYGGVKQFTTLSESPPTVSTGSVSDIKENSATGRATVSANGGATITEYGVVYGTSSNPTTSNFKSSTTGAPTLGSEYTFNLAGLSANTTYYVRGFAANSAGTGYGTQTSFKTAPPVPVATAATLVGESSFRLNWNASTGAIKYYLDISTSSDFSSFISEYNNKDVGNVTSHDISGLNPGVTYYYRLRAYNGDATSGNSNTISTTTKVLDNFLVEAFGEGPIPTQTAGQSFNVRITARDNNNERIIDYTSNAVITSNGNLSDGNQTISSVTTGNFTGGVYTSQSVILTLTGNDITVTATKNAKTGVSNEFTVMPGPINYYTIVANPDGEDLQQSVMAGVAFDVLVKVYDEYGNIKTDYDGDKPVLWETTATPSRSGDIYEIPGDGVQTFNSGVATIGSFVLYDAEEQPTITITDGPTSSPGTTSPILVMPNDLNNFTLEENPEQLHSIGGVRVTAGENFSVKVTARDVYQNVKRDYEGNIQFKSSNDLIVNYPNELQQFTLADKGVRVLTNVISIPTTGEYWLRAADSPLAYKTGDLTNIIVGPGTYSTSASEFTATSATTGLTAGDYVNVLITPRDAEGNLLCDCQDVAIKLNGETYDWDSDPNPISVTDNHDGTYTAAIRITQLGTNTLTASVDGSTMSTEIEVVVDNPAAPSYLAINGTGTQVAGIAQDITITAYDEFHNKAVSYTGTKQIRFGGASASNAPVTNPTIEGTSFADNTTIEFAAGEATVAMILYKVESAKVTATDWTSGSEGITTPDDVVDGETTYVYQLPVEVTPAAADYLAISGSATQEAGTTQDITITAYDEFNNVATTYSGTKQIRVTGANPSDAPEVENPTVESIDFGANTEMDFANGAVTVSMALFKAESAKITAADWTSGSEGIISPDDVIDGGSTYVYQLPVVVNATSPSYFAITGSDTQTAGVAQNITITMFDQYNNIATSYDGDMDLTFTGANASFDGINPEISATDFGITTTITFSNGVAENVSMTLFDAANETQDALVNVSNGSQSATGQELAVNVIPNSATKLRIDTEPSAYVRAGNEFDQQPVISIRDAYGNMVDDNTTTVTATANGTESLVGTTQITAANGIVSFTDLSYQKMETITIDFDANPALTTVTSGSILVDHNATVKYVYSTTPPYIYAGGQRGAYTVERYDAYDNLVNNVVNPDGSDSNADETVFLYSDNTDVNTKFYDVATGGSALTSVPITNGATSVNFWYYSEKEGNHLITASDKSSLDAPDEDTENATNTLEVKPAALSHFVVSGVGTETNDGWTQHYYGDRQTVTVEAIDIFGNRKINYTGTVTFSLTDAEANEPGDAGNNYPVDYTFTLADGGIHTFDNAILFERPSFEHPSYPTTNEWWVTVVDQAQPSKYGSQVKIEVLKRPITVTAHNQTKQYYGDTYDLGNTEFTVTSGITEYQNPDVFAGTEGISNVTLSSDGTAASALAGDYQIVPSNVVGINDFNENYYDITFEDGTLSVDPRPITITVAANQSKTYGDADPSDYSYTVTEGSLASGDTFSGNLTREAGEDAGLYEVYQTGLTITEDATDKTDNYDITFVNDNKFEITQLDVAVNAEAKNKTYGDIDPALTFVAAPAVGTTLANGEVIAFTGELNRDAGENVGNYAINQNSVDNANYNITYTGANLTIDQLDVAVNAEAKNKTYGDIDPALTFVAAPAVGTTLANGEVIAFTGELNRDAGENVGDYAINQNSVDNANYNITYTGANLTIDQLDVAVSAEAKNKTYGDIDPALTFVAAPAVGTTLANGEVIAFTGELNRDAGENVGDYAINQNSVDNANYNITYTGANLTIDQLDVAVSAEAKNKTYGDIDPALTFVAAPAVGTTLANGEVIAFTGELNRDAGENVGNYAINQNSVDNANYNITYTGANLTIGQLDVAVNAEAKNKTYGDIDPALTFVAVPAVGTTLANGEVIAFTGELNRDEGENVGDYAINQNSVDNANYNITYTGANLTIGQLDVAVNAEAKNKTYGDIDPALTFVAAPAVGTTLANGEVIAFTGELNRDEGENVGNYAIKQNSVDNANYNITYTGANLTIGQLDVAVNAEAKNKTYGDIDPALTFVAAPAVGTTLANGEVIAFTGELNRDAGENVGDYAINQNSVDNANYNITYTGANLTIGQLDVTVNAEAKNKTYGDIDPALTFVAAPAVGTTLANGEVIAFTGELNRDAGENVGDYAINQNSVDNANYNITYTGANLTIGQLDVAVNAEAKNKTYGDIDPALTFVAAPAVGTTLANGEVIAFTGELNRDAGENVGDYAINQNSVDNANYNITYTGANLTIDQLDVAVSAEAKNKTYGDIDPALTFVAAPAVGTTLANGEVIAFTGELNRDAGENVGNYAINQNSVDNANYNITYTGANLTIGQLDVAVNAEAKNKTYGDIDPALTFVAAPAVGTTLANGEVIAFTGELSRDAGENVGDYAINQNSVDNANYNITYTGANLTIGQLDVAVSAEAKNKTYGDIDPALTFVAAPAVGTTLANGEVIAFTGELNRDAGENVGDYAINQNSVDNANYNITYTGANLTIDQLDVAVSAEAKNKTYGDIDPALTFVAAPAVGTTLANGEVIAFTGELNRDAGENVGNYAINQNSVDNANYNITYTGANLTIGQLDVAVNAEAKNKTYGDIDPALTFVTAPAVGTTLANGEVIAFTGELNRDAGENVGDYAINQNSVDNANYNITYTGTNLTIGQLDVAVSAEAKNKTYGDIDPALTFVAAPAVGTTLANGEVIAFTGELNRDAGENVGDYALTQGTLDNSNYNITFVSNTFEITKLRVAVAADAYQSKTYGDLDPVFTYASNPVRGSTLPNNEVVNFSGEMIRVEGENVGFYAIEQGTLDNTNYDITFVSNDFEITPLDVTVTADADQSKTYGELDPVFEYTSVPAVGATLANGKVVSFAGVLDRTAGEDAGLYAIGQGTLDNPNYSINFMTDNFEITKLEVTVTANADQSKTYGELDPVFEYSSIPAVGTTLANSEVIGFTGVLDRAVGEDAGLYAIGQGTLDNPNYSINFMTDNFEITKLEVTVTANAGQSKTYGDLDPVFEYTSVPAVETTLANSEVIGFTGELDRVAGEDAGLYAIGQGTLDNPNYSINFMTDNFEITKLEVTVTANADQSKTYGDLDPVFEYSSIPAVGTTLANSEVIGFTGELDRAVGEDAGLYAIGQGTLDNPNYSINFMTDNFEITKLEVTVTADADQSKTYGELDPVFEYSSIPAVGTTLANSEVIGFTGELDRAVGEDAGLYAIGQGTLDNPNYSINFMTDNFEITKLEVTVTANAGQSKTYGELDPVFEYTSVPAVGTTLANSEVIGFTGELDRAAGEDAGLYAIGQGTLDNPNYSINFMTDNFEITKLEVTVTADADQSKTYGELDPVFEYSSIPAVGTTLANSEVIGFTGELDRAAGEDAGLYAIGQGTLDNPNYSINFMTDNFEITKLEVTVTANAGQSKTYGELDPVFEYSSIPAVGTTLANGKVVSFAGEIDRVTGEDAGSYEINLGTLSNSNYNITYVGDIFEITTKALTITADDKSKTYDGTVYNPFTVSYNGFVNDEDESVLEGALTFSGTAANAFNAGTDYVITPQGLTSTNYAITFVDGLLDITAKSLTITADNKSKIYDGEVYSPFTVSYDGFIGSENESNLDGELTFSGSAVNATEVGADYIITPEGFTSSNYEITYVSGSLIIVPHIVGDTNGDGIIGEDEITGDINGDGIISDNEVSGDIDGDGIIGDGEIAGDNNGDGVIDENETAGDTNGDGQMTDGEIAGDTNGDGQISENEVAGDTNGDGNISGDEVAGDANGDGFIDVTELAGDTNGDGAISGSEIAGDTNGDGAVDTGEISGDANGDGQIDSDEIAGDRDGDGNIATDEIAGDIDGNGSISGVEIVGDKNGDSQISGSEIAGDANGDGIIGAGEARMIDPNKDHINITKLFTPNNDGFNDYWKIDNILELGRVQVKIYDRAGKLLYESSAYQNDWDGTSKGKSVPEGAYIYHVKTELAGTTTGVVNIVR